MCVINPQAGFFKGKAKSPMTPENNITVATLLYPHCFAH